MSRSSSHVRRRGLSVRKGLFLSTASTLYLPQVHFHFNSGLIVGQTNRVMETLYLDTVRTRLWGCPGGAALQIRAYLALMVLLEVALF